MNQWGIQAFGSELAVERLDEAVVGRFAWPREVERDATPIGPEVEVTADELGAWLTRMMAGKPWAAPTCSRTSTTSVPKKLKRRPNPGENWLKASMVVRTGSCGRWRAGRGKSPWPRSHTNGLRF
jgi:hypothetical protein